jgi:hypothetical protein
MVILLFKLCQKHHQVANNTLVAFRH